MSMSDFLWNLANGIALIHIWVVVPLLLFVVPLFGRKYGGSFIFMVVSAQSASLGCPLTHFEFWLRRLARPGKVFDTFSLTREMYAWMGAWAALPIAFSSVMCLFAVLVFVHTDKNVGKWRPRYEPRFILTPESFLTRSVRVIARYFHIRSL